mgnify:CR=1 FL=1
MKNLISFLIISLLSVSCVEHKISIIVEPDGSFKYSHNASGDKQDLQDLDFPLSKNLDWNMENNFDEESDNYFYNFGRLFEKNSIFPNTFYLGDSINRDILLKHNVEVNYSNSFIYEHYNLIINFNGRDASKKYPLLKEFLLDQENPPANWVHDGLSYIFNQAVLESNFGFNIENIIKTAISEWLENIKQSYDNTSLQENFENVKTEGINIIQSNLIDNSIDNFKEIINKYEQEARITIDLSDDIIEFYTVLPGFVHETNADSIFNDTLLWRFSGIDFADNNYEIVAKSSIYHKSRFHWTITIIMVLVAFITLYIISSKVPDPSESSK